MAGSNHHNVLHEDPAFVKYANLNTNRFRYFRWTPRTAKIAFVYAIAIPAVVAYIGYKTEGKYELRGKRRGDTIKEF